MTTKREIERKKEALEKALDTFVTAKQNHQLAIARLCDAEVAVGDAERDYNRTIAAYEGYPRRKVKCLQSLK